MRRLHEKTGHELQEQFCGRRYRGANLASTRFTGEDAERVQAFISRPKNFLTVTGPAGTGKTFFCAAMIDALNDQMEYVYYYKEGKLLSELRQLFSSSDSSDYLEYLDQRLDHELFILDDLGSMGHTDWREEILTYVIDSRYESGYPTIVTTNLGKAEVYRVYGERVGSRLFARENTWIDMSSYADLRESGF